MSKESLKTDRQHIKTMPDEEIDLSDIAEITEEQMARAGVLIGDRPVPEGNARVRAKVEMLVDADVVAYVKMKVGKRNYESVMNEMLRSDIRRGGDIHRAAEGGPGNRISAVL